jgi:uncharacterized linocin/CFP29 family protein
MDILRRELAPISAQGWKEIDSMARETLIANLSGRKFVDLDGPHGIDHTCINLGRLSVPKKQESGEVGYGIYQVQPLVEARVNFTIETWELDNVERGAKDIRLDSLVAACRDIAGFEEKAIFKGFKPGTITGLLDTVKGSELSMKLDMDSIVDAVSEAQTKLLEEGVDGPANLVVSPKIWKFLARTTPGGTLRSILEIQIGGSVIYAALAQDALLVAGRGGDTELTVGQDLAVGYHNHSTTGVNLFVTESFTFRVVTPEALIGFKLN